MIAASAKGQIHHGTPMYDPSTSGFLVCKASCCNTRQNIFTGSKKRSCLPTSPKKATPSSKGMLKNDQDMADTRRRYMEGVLYHSFVDGIRGEVLAVPLVETVFVS